MAAKVAELEAYRSGARALAARILSAQEAERVRVSRELHDDTGQALTLILVRLELIASMTSDHAVKRELAELRSLVSDTLEDVRRLAVRLGPSILDDLGLRSALEWLADRVREEARLHVTLALEIEDDVVPPTIALAVFRVAQEALTNVVRHAAAASAVVRLDETGDTVRLVVADDGIGFDPAEARARPSESVGLFGMAERVALVGGDMQVISRPGGVGTRVEVRIPLRERDRT